MFDSKLFADEILSHKTIGDINLMQLLKLVYSMPTGKLGKIFVKYGDAVQLNTYLEKNSGSTFRNLTYKLSKEFTLYQLKEQPIFNNSMISAIILHHSKPTISFKKIL